MPTHTMLVFSNPAVGREDEFNRWYDQQHIPDILNVPGFVAAQRFRLSNPQPRPEQQKYAYAVVYDIETDDLDGTLSALASAAKGMTMTDAMQRPALQSVFSAVGPRVEIPRRK